MIFFGNKEPQKIFFGNKEVVSMYFGSVKVWPNYQPPADVILDKFTLTTNLTSLKIVNE